VDAQGEQGGLLKNPVSCICFQSSWFQDLSCTCLVVCR
jgi:hypothetical protein